MSDSPTADPVPSLPARIARYREPDTWRSLWQLGNSAALFVASWVAMHFLLRVSYALALLLAVPAAFFVVRLFIIQHDCGHGSFIRPQRLADAIGRAIGVLTLTPYTYWRRTHAIHHSTSGNLGERGLGDIQTLTVAEYRALSKWGKLQYRVYRHPFVIFGVGASLHFIVRHRLPTIVPREWKRERASILLTNLGLLGAVAAMVSVVGWKELVMIQLPITILACSIGVWLFYVQHQFERTYWAHDPAWTASDAALIGSSHLELPRVLQWATGNIGIHHVHHLNPTVPNYRLPEVLRGVPELAAVPSLGIRQAFACARLALWDEQGDRLVTFRQAGRSAQA